MAELTMTTSETHTSLTSLATGLTSTAVSTNTESESPTTVQTTDSSTALSTSVPSSTESISTKISTLSENTTTVVESSTVGETSSSTESTVDSIVTKKYFSTTTPLPKTNYYVVGSTSMEPEYDYANESGTTARGMEPGAIVGLVAASLSLLGIILLMVLGIYYCYKRRKGFRGTLMDLLSECCPGSKKRAPPPKSKKKKLKRVRKKDKDASLSEHLTNENELIETKFKLARLSITPAAPILKDVPVATSEKQDTKKSSKRSKKLKFDRVRKSMTPKSMPKTKDNRTFDDIAKETLEKLAREVAEGEEDGTQYEDDGSQYDGTQYDE